MKKIILVSVGFFFSFSLLLVRGIMSQEFDYRRAYEDYLYTFNLYHQAHNQFAEAKSAYLNYQTLKSKEEATSKTLALLQARDQVVRTYLTALRLRLAEAGGLDEPEKENWYSPLDIETTWYFDHHESLTSAGRLEDLLGLSEPAEKKYFQTKALAFQILINILTGKEKILRNQINAEITKIDNKLAAIREKGDKQTVTLERWLLEAENKIDRSLEKEALALEKTESLWSDRRQQLKTYHEARTLLEESHIYLKEALDYLEELIQEVKIADAG